MRKYLTILAMALIVKINAQSYTYSYTDPCNGNTKTISVPINGTISVSYYGEIGTFTASDFSNGVFETWTQNTLAQYGGDSPCSQIIGLPTAISTTQSQVINTVSILNSLSTLAEITGSTNIIAGSTNTINGSSNSQGSNNSKGKSEKDGNKKSTQKEGENTGQSTENQQNTSGSQTTKSEGSNTSGSGGTTTESGGNGSGGGSSSGTGGVSKNTGSSEESTKPKTEEAPTETEGKTNITGGSTNTIKGSTTTNSNGRRDNSGGKPTVIASSDFVGFNFRNSDVSLGAKATGGYTALRWDGKRSWGTLFDYTSALKGPNITAFYALLNNKNVTLFSSTLTLGFDKQKSVYGTISGGYMLTPKKIKGLKTVYMGTVSYGSVYRTKFIGTALICGFMYDFKIGKRIDIKLMDLLIYSPYVSYYNDIVLKSPYVMIPSIGTNISVTKKFKFNINAGGAWPIGSDAINYTLTCGARMIVGQ